MAPRDRDEIAIVELLAVKPPPHFQLAQMAPRIRQELAIGIAGDEIAHAAGRRGWGGRGGGGGAYSRPASAKGERHAALLQDAIGRRDRPQTEVIGPTP